MSAGPGFRWPVLAALAGGFVLLALFLVWPAIDGPFLSDDHFVILNNRYVHGLSWYNVRSILDPWGAAAINTLNYAPVHLLLHAAQWQWVGDETRLYHVTNAVAHGATSALLVPYFVRAGIPRTAAALGALVFLVHPANLEAVAWIFQLKTLVALGFAIGALLLHERRPALAALLFTLALLTKITAIGILPLLAVQSWVRSGGDRPAPPRWGWVAVWAVIAGAILVPEMAAFQRQDDVRIVIHDDPWVYARTIVAIAGRYLWMAATGLGVAPFHEPPPAESWLDPWWLAGGIALAAIGARTLQTLLRRDEEACFWVLAAAGFGPVSQIFPFIFPMGDRYLHPILPGLIGAGILAATPAWRWAAARLDDRVLLERLTVAAALGLALFWGGQTRARAPVFANQTAFMHDAALRYPDGMMAQLLKGHQAARIGNAEGSARAFERAVDLGFSDLQALLAHPELAEVRRTPVFQQHVLRKLADLEIERLSRHEHPEESELIRMAIALDLRGEPEAALRALERAQQDPGAFHGEVDQLAEALRRRLAREGTSPATSD